jgi:hypothetical protein
MSLVDLRAALRAHGGMLAEYLGPSPLPRNGHDGLRPPGLPAGEPGSDAPALAAAGPRAAQAPAEYELLMEMILEGSLLHYGRARVVTASDPDLALLLGDELYALGLARVAQLGDLEAVTELADLISLLALAQAAGDRSLADAVWRAGAIAIGWGSSPAHVVAKAAARRGEAGAADALTDAGEAVLAPSEQALANPRS